MGKRGEITQEKILSVLKAKGVALSAYDILDELREGSPKIAPPTIYRALKVLVDQGHVHRLESLNAFIASTGKTQDQASIMSICDDCGIVEENVAPKLVNDLSGILGKTGFEAHHHVIEVHGRCASCDDEGAAS
ncbi:MAG: transcriptional repressor [Pseudomonadota bacterium]